MCDCLVCLLPHLPNQAHWLVERCTSMPALPQAGKLGCAVAGTACCCACNGRRCAACHAALPSPTQAGQHSVDRYVWCCDGDCRWTDSIVMNNIRFCFTVPLGCRRAPSTTCPRCTTATTCTLRPAPGRSPSPTSTRWVSIPQVSCKQCPLRGAFCVLQHTQPSFADANSAALHPTHLQGVVYGVRTEETMADRALINRYDYDGIFGTGEFNLLDTVACFLWPRVERGRLRRIFSKAGAVSVSNV